MNMFYGFLSTLLGILLYVTLGVYTLSTSLETINGMTGAIWTQMRAGFEKMDAIESQLGAAYTDRKDLISTIVQARKDYTQATRDKDLKQAAQSAASLGSTLKIMIENYPQTDLAPVQTGVLDETAGIFNRIAYARQKLIDAQVSYNQSRIFFFVVSPWFARQAVIGEAENPMAHGPRSRFA